MKQRVLEILSDLVACDTQNPPRGIESQGPVYRCLTQWLDPSFELRVKDYGIGRVNWLAVRGKPTRLFNVHLDTVPAAEGWSHPPLQLSLDAEKAYGRGVCDIKGAAACLIAAANQSDDVAILFSSDEEGAQSCCITEFCRSADAGLFDSFVIAEPTGCQAVLGHRGYLSVTGKFQGISGHTSQHQLLAKSANHLAARWVAEALQQVAEFEVAHLNGESTCFNVGRIEGGLKNNMVSEHCTVTWSARMPAGFLNQKLLQALQIEDTPETQWQTTFDGPPLPGSPGQHQETQVWCQEQGLEVANDVDFWTEAALFARLGKPTIVLGPGDISQAHTVDEWVAIEQLEQAANRYLKLMQQG